jgi:hypothetical protein
MDEQNRFTIEWDTFCVKVILLDVLFLDYSLLEKFIHIFLDLSLLMTIVSYYYFFLGNAADLLPGILENMMAMSL